MSALISVVIPALNEEKQLPGNLVSLLRINAVCELIVVDGGSQDGTLGAVKNLIDSASDDRLRVYESAPGRALQMNYGAARASGEWLLFHHADSLLDERAVNAVAALDPAYQWGGFEHSFAPNNWKLQFVSWLHNFRCRRTGVVYGDQSLFVRRAFFDHLGGFKDQTIEDLEFSDRALAIADSVLLPFRVRTDSRKFTQIGEFRALLQVAIILWRYERERRVGMSEFFKPYR